MKNCTVLAAYTIADRTDALLRHDFEQPSMGCYCEFIIAHGYNWADGDWGYGTYYFGEEIARKDFAGMMKEHAEKIRG